MTHARALLFALTLCLCVAILPLRGDDARKAQSTEQAASDMAAAATNLWNALTADQQSKAGFAFDDEERLDWHFIPKARKGLTLKDMTSAQRVLAHAFLSSAMSHKGYLKAVTIMSLDDILKVMENGKGPTRDPELYYFSIFGKPGASEPWGWRVEGHHVSLNFTIVGGKSVAAGPVFLGSNPAEVREGPRKGLRVLGEEDDLGRALVKSLSDDRRKTAIIDANAAPKDIISFNKRHAMLLDPPGIGYGQLKDEQKKQLVALVADYADRLRTELAADDVVRIAAAGWENVKFAWAGGLEPGQGHYYRVQGPTFLIEFDNTQNDANHVHSVWRDLTRDWGEDLLGKHYAEAHN